MLEEHDNEDLMDEVSLDLTNQTHHDIEDDRRRDEAEEDRLIPWTEFTEDFHMMTPEFSTVEDTCEENKDKLIDLRPYM